MNPAWDGFLRGGPAAHGAQVYQDVSELAASVSRYLAIGFDLGEPAVVIATPEHWDAIEADLGESGWSADRIADSGLLLLLDAETTLERILDEDALSRSRFDAVIGGAMDDVAARFPGRRIRAFGEVVDLLCKRGRAEVADQLEGLWNGLSRRRSFSLLCGYHADVFDPETQARLLPGVCRSHSHLLPAADVERLGAAVDEALADALGADAEMIHAVAGQGLGRKHVPRPQLALMWVSSRMPQSAASILASARERYRAEIA